MKETEPHSKGLAFVVASFLEARKRLSLMNTEDAMRDENEIWEVYCDIEQGVQVSKYVFGVQDGLGVIRKITASARNDPSKIPLGELSRRYKIVDSHLAEALEALRNGMGEEEIEIARKARDELKRLLLGRRAGERATQRKTS
jgi:hypothetical protein